HKAIVTPAQCAASLPNNPEHDAPAFLRLARQMARDGNSVVLTERHMSTSSVMASSASGAPPLATLSALKRAAASCLLAALAALVLGAGAARANEASAALVTPDEMHAGSLLFGSTEPGRYIEAPRLGTDVNIVVSGPTARARITQIFKNPTNGWVEGVYVYPLPDGGAVDTLKMVIGDRIVVGDIKERQEARRLYEQAKSAGRKATLLEQ